MYTISVPDTASLNTLWLTDSFNLEPRLSQISFLPVPTNCTSSYSLKTWLFRVTYRFRMIPKFMFSRRHTNAAQTRGNRGRASNFIQIPNKSDCLSRRESASLPAFERADVGFAWQAWNFVRGLHFRGMREKYGIIGCNLTNSTEQVPLQSETVCY